MKDLVLIHGMFSGAIAMRPLARSIEKRGIYRKVIAIDLDNPSHRYVPRVYAESNATNLAAQLDSKISRRALSESFDVLGHSNGGYVALFLNEFLQRGKAEWIFTVATPRGISLDALDIALPAKDKRKVIHFRGALDGVPFGYRHNPADGRLVVSFPDEGHSSLHLGANSNGLADFIGLINKSANSDAFIDSSGTIHIWPHCREEIGAGSIVKVFPGKMTECVVCNGMHDFDLETLKKNKETWASIFLQNPSQPQVALIRYGAHRLERFLKIREVLKRKLRETRDQVHFAKLYGKALRSELRELGETQIRFSKNLDEIDKRLRIFSDAARKRHKDRLEKIVHPLSLAEEYAKALPIVDSEAVAEITRLLVSSSREFETYFREMKSNKQMYVAG